MRLQLTPSNKLTYKLKLTPQMRLAINLLQMPLVKLQEYIKQQIEENPLLEVENIGQPSKPKEKFEEVTESVPLWQENYNIDDEEKKNYRESLITKHLTLQEHLLRQLMLLIDSEKERKIGELIIGNIDNDGYLRCSVEDIVEDAKTTSSKVEEVLSLIQTFDPIGSGARDIRECLLLQLKAKGKDNSLVYQIIDKYLPYLEKKRFEFIAKKLSATKRGGSASGGKVSVERVKDAMEEIARLEPKPGRSFTTERTVHLIPDAILRKNKEGYEVILNNSEIPRVTINDKYKKMIEQKDAPQDAKEYLRERLKAAYSLINAINKRGQTIQKVLEEIVYVQKEFLDNGEANFKPMTLEQIAKRIGKHKSTVSRAVTNKYLHTPWGIFELRDFLSSGVKQENGESYSSKAIKSKIKALLENENKQNPLTDQQIVKLLKQDGISISRRTIAKYRNQLKILSSKSRRE